MDQEHDLPRLRYRRQTPIHRKKWWVSHEGVEFHISSTQASILIALALAYPCHVPSEELVDGLYGHQEDGGPLFARRSISVQTCKLNQNLREVGYEVRGRKGFGGFSLVRCKARWHWPMVSCRYLPREDRLVAEQYVGI